MDNTHTDTLFTALCRAAIGILKPEVRQKDLADECSLSEVEFHRMLLGKKPMNKEIKLFLVKRLNLAPMLDGVTKSLMEGE